MTRESARIVALAIALAAATADEAAACVCPAQGPSCEAAGNADVVFAGTVQAISRLEADDLVDGGSRLRVIFVVEQGYRNAAAGLLSVTTAESAGMCGYRFEIGKQYLVYGRSVAPSRISTSSCSRTRLLADAHEDLRYLKSITSSTMGGPVYGRITEARRDPSVPYAIQQPVEGVTVILAGMGGSRSAITDADGRYELAGHAATKLTISVQAPAEFDSTHLSREIELKDPRSCSEQNFELRQVARLSGWVVDATGQPLAGIPVDAVAADVARFAELAGFAPDPLLPRAHTDARGHFEFSDLPPGTYVFGVNLTKEGNGVRRGPPTFLPGTATVQDATVVELKPKDDKDAGILRLIQP